MVRKKNNIAPGEPARFKVGDRVRFMFGSSDVIGVIIEDRGPIEAGLGWCCKEHTQFIGSEAVAKMRASEPSEKLVPFTIDGQGIARQGNPISGGGEVTSGTFSPCLERGIGMAYVPAQRSEPGTRIEIDVRGTPRPAVVEQKPLYRKAS